MFPQIRNEIPEIRPSQLLVLKNIFSTSWECFLEIKDEITHIMNHEREEHFQKDPVNVLYLYYAHPLRWSIVAPKNMRDNYCKDKSLFTFLSVNGISKACDCLILVGAICKATTEKMYNDLMNER